MDNEAATLRTTKSKFSHFLDRRLSTREILFLSLAALCSTSWISPPVALLLGLVVAQVIGHPFLHLNHKATQRLLQFSVVGLGFGMNAATALQSGKEGLLFTIASIGGTLVVGLIAGRLFKIEKKAAYLISVGTAVCGGSAIAAVAPVIKAEEKQISIALGSVFILNAIALFLFPAVGQALQLSPHQFGLWCAIAIHDTSSVVGAASKYGADALQVATTVKLARALWIIPVAFASSFLFNKKGAKVKIPYFIGWFVVAILLNTYVPGVSQLAPYITGAAHAGLTLTLFLIGSGLSRGVLLATGFRPLLQGVVLWALISAAALWAITTFMT